MQTLDFLIGLTPLKSEPYPFTELQLTWLEALKSGKYKQGQGFLKDVYGGYCCLGVLCELAGYQSQKVPGAVGEAFMHDGVAHASYLPFPVVTKAFLNGSMGRFTQSVMFPNFNYGKLPKNQFFDIESTELPIKGHASLASMNDTRVIVENEKQRAFNFTEIAAYIEFDPWNVFTAPAYVEVVEMTG